MLTNAWESPQIVPVYCLKQGFDVVVHEQYDSNTMPDCAPGVN